MLKNMYEYGIGNTPMIELEAAYGNRIFLKMEKYNFLESIKARTGFWIVHDLPKVAQGRTIVESTSGNLGFALGFFCRETGRDFLCLVDSSIAKGKLERLRKSGIAYEMVEKEEEYDMRNSRIRYAKRLNASGEYYWVNQYDNASGIKAHVMTTGPEIWEQTHGKVTHCVCAMGSGGTVCGISRYLKSVSPSVRICGVEPYGSTIFAEKEDAYINVGAGLTGKPGNILNSPNALDMHYVIKDEESIYYAKELMKQHQFCVGVTSGMAYAAALRIAKTVRESVIVVVAPDGGEPYGEYLQ